MAKTTITQQDMTYSTYLNSGKNFMMLLTMFETQAEILALLKNNAGQTTTKDEELIKIKQRWSEITDEELEPFKKQFGIE